MTLSSGVVGVDCESSEDAEWKLVSDVAGDGDGSSIFAFLYPIIGFSSISINVETGSDEGDIKVLSEVDAMEALVLCD